MNLDVRDKAFWDERQLDEEIRRVFDICHGCRLCFNLCGSFPALFDAIDDETANESVAELTSEHIDRVLDLCFQCKLCYVKCPYTPPHQYMLDFPRLMMRAKAVRVAESGVPFRDRLLSDPDTAGKLARWGAPMINWAGRNPMLRRVAEAVMGIHRDRNLPEFHFRTFRSWFSKFAGQPAEAPTAKVALFHTCFVNYNEPSIGQDAVEVLARNDVEVVCPDQKCCGMPAVDAGDLDTAREHAHDNIASLLPYVQDGYTVVVPNPTCSYMLKHEYPLIVDTDESRAVSEATRDLCEFLMELHGQGGLDTDFKSSPESIGYHVPCHLRAQNIGYKSRDLMQLIPEAKVNMVEACSGHDGTWSMKKPYFEASMKIGSKLFRQLQSDEPKVLASDCPLAALQIEKGLGRRALHPVQIIHKAYQGESFEGL